VGPGCFGDAVGSYCLFFEYLKLSGRFDALVADCPVVYRSPNAPRKRDLLGTTMLAILAGHWRYAHITALRGDTVTPALLGITRVLSEDAVRRGLGKIDEPAGAAWLRGHLDDTVRPLLSAPWTWIATPRSRRCTAIRRGQRSVTTHTSPGVHPRPTTASRSPACG
jgi:hypothetical protein